MGFEDTFEHCPDVYTVTTGRVQSFKFPLTLPGEWLEYKIHGDIITQMKLSLDDNRLITASKDGSLCFWQVRLFNLTWFFFTLSIYFQLKILISIKLSNNIKWYLVLSYLISRSRHRTTNFLNSESRIFTTKFLF